MLNPSYEGELHAFLVYCCPNYSKKRHIQPQFGLLTHVMRLDLFFSKAHEPKKSEKTAEVASLAPEVLKMLSSGPIPQRATTDFLRYMDVPKIVGFPPKSSNLIGISIINHPCWGTTIFGNTRMIKTIPVLP